MLKRANTLLETPELSRRSWRCRDVMTDARQLLATADTQVGSLGLQTGGDRGRSPPGRCWTPRSSSGTSTARWRPWQAVPETLTSAKEALTAARSTLGQVQKSLGTLTDAATVLKQADKTFIGTAALTGPDSAVLRDLAQTLKAFEEAARAPDPRQYART